jgi:inosose dehydratase
MNAAGIMRDKNYKFSEHKTQIANALNEAAKAVADIGLQAVLHQHTQTMVETRDEVYAIMDAVDTKYVKAGFDVGQLKKGGSDPVEIIRNFLPVIEHMHLKDYDGKEHWLGYAPFGQGTNDLKTILALMESKGPIQGMIMVELDPDPHPPIPALETAKIAKTYLQNLGYSFRS